MIMTSKKAQKTAIRQRMAETGEPYVVARSAVLDEGGESAEEQYLRDAADAGVPAEELNHLRAGLLARNEEAADEAEEAEREAEEAAIEAEETAFDEEDAPRPPRSPRRPSMPRPPRSPRHLRMPRPPRMPRWPDVPA
jgi:hypothetical protein